MDRRSAPARQKDCDSGFGFTDNLRERAGGFPDDQIGLSVTPFMGNHVSRFQPLDQAQTDIIAMLIAVLADGSEGRADHHALWDIIDSDDRDISGHPDPLLGQLVDDAPGD